VRNSQKEREKCERPLIGSTIDSRRNKGSVLRTRGGGQFQEFRTWRLKVTDEKQPNWLTKPQQTQRKRAVLLRSGRKRVAIGPGAPGLEAPLRNETDINCGGI
jgi:hypothetical protein